MMISSFRAPIGNMLMHWLDNLFIFWSCRDLPTCSDRTMFFSFWQLHGCQTCMAANPSLSGCTQMDIHCHVWILFRLSIPVHSFGQQKPACLEHKKCDSPSKCKRHWKWTWVCVFHDLLRHVSHVIEISDAQSGRLVRESSQIFPQYGPKFWFWISIFAFLSVQSPKFNHPWLLEVLHGKLNILEVGWTCFLNQNQLNTFLVCSKYSIQDAQCSRKPICTKREPPVFVVWFFCVFFFIALLWGTYLFGIPDMSQDQLWYLHVMSFFGEINDVASHFFPCFFLGDGFHRFCAANYQLCQDWCLVAMWDVDAAIHSHKMAICCNFFNTRWWFQGFFFHPYLGKWYNLTHIFQMGGNHQLDNFKIYKDESWNSMVDGSESWLISWISWDLFQNRL